MSETAQHIPTQVLSRAALFDRRLPDLPGANEPGYARTAFKGLAGAEFKTNVVAVPTGQRSTERVSVVDHIILVLKGEFELAVEGEMHVLDEWAQIFVPRGISWSYRNVGQTDATFVSITGIG